MVDFYSLAIDKLYLILRQGLEKLFIEEEIEKTKVDFLVEVPQEKKFGDFATNVAMVAAKIFKKNPFELAEKLLQNISLDGTFFSKFEVKRPGFINFFLGDEWYSSVLKEVLNEGENFGKTEYGKGKKAILEYVSANPTGPMHIGNARGGAIGDSLAECFRFAGFEVLKEFYVNDAGNQIEKFKKSLNLRYEQIFLKDENFEMPQDCYLGEDIKEHAENFAKIYKDEFMKKDVEERKTALLNYALPLNIKNLKLDLEKYKVLYDNWFFESSLYEDNSVFDIVKDLEEKGYTFKKDGATWFSFTKCGGDKDEVLIRDNGVPTYFASDIAYHFDKFKKRGFDIAIDIWGADHHGHIKRLKAALSVLGVDSSSLEVVLMQMVRLVEKGKTLKLSKRAGNTITLNSLLEMIPIDVARFFFNMKEPNTHFDFDLDLARQESDKNPVYYVQYAYARACGILKKLKQEQNSLDFKDVNFNISKTKEEIDLIKQIAKFPTEIINAVLTYNPSRIAHFCFDLSTLFHKFYVNCKIKGQEEEILRFRVCLCVAVLNVLKNSFSILKIEAKEEV